MKQAHIPLRMLRGDRGNQGAQEHLGKARRHGENHGAGQEAQIGMLRPKGGHGGVDQKAQAGEQGHDLDDPGDIELFGKDRKNQVNAQLGAEIRQHQGAQERIRDPIQLMEGDEQQRRQAEHR